MRHTTRSREPAHRFHGLVHANPEVGVVDDGTKSSGTYVVDDGYGFFRTVTVGGSFTIGVPGYSGNWEVLATNDGTGGYTLTTSSYSKVLGDTYDATASNKNIFRITVIGAFSLLEILNVS